MAESFGALLRRLRLERGLSQNQLAHAAAIDPAHVNRLERVGERNSRTGAAIRPTSPGRAVVLALADALALSYAERDRLLFVAGLAPETDWQARCEDAEAALCAVRAAVGAGDATQLALSEPLDSARDKLRESNGPLGIRSVS